MDTLMMHRTLVQSGIQPAQAEAVITVITGVTGGVATKADLALVEAKLDQFRAETRAEFAAWRSEMKAEFGAVRSETKTEFAAVRSETKTEFGAVRSEAKTEFAVVRSEMALARVETKAAIAEVKVDMVRWMVGIALAQTGLTVATIRSLLP